MPVITSAISGAYGPIALTGSLLMSGSTSGSEGTTSGSEGTIIHLGSGSSVTVSISGTLLSSYALTSSTSASAGTTTYGGSGSYTTVSTSGSYMSSSSDSGSTSASAGTTTYEDPNAYTTVSTSGSYTSGSGGTTETSGGASTYHTSGSDMWWTYSSSGSYGTDSEGSGSTSGSAGVVTFSGSDGYTTISYTGSYTSGSGGTTETSGGSIVVSGSSPGVTLHTADLYVGGVALVTGAISGASTLHTVGAITSKGNIATSGSATAGTSFVIGSADLNETDLEKLDGITDGAGAANKALVLDGNADVASGLRSVTGSGDAKFANFHATGKFYGDGSGLTSVSAGTPTSLSGTTAQLTTGVETSGYLKVSGSSTLGAITATTYSGSSTLYAAGAATFSSTIAATGSITGGGVISSGGVTVAQGAYSGSAGFHTVGLATFGNDILASGSIVGNGVTSLGGFTAAGGHYSGSGDFHTVGHVTLGGNLTATGSVNANGLTSTGPAVLNSISASSTLHNVGVGTFGDALLATGSITTDADLTVGGGDIGYGNGQNATLSIANGSGTNTAGRDLTISAGNGTGTGVPGSMSFRVPKVGTSGDTVHTDVEILTIRAEGVNTHWNQATAMIDDEGMGDIIYMGTGTTTAGKMYYLNSGSAWAESSAALAESGAVGLLGVAIGSNPTSNGMLVRGFYDVTSYFSGAFTVGQPVYIQGAATISTMRPSGSGEMVRIVGHCTTTANVIYFNPSSEYIELA